MSKRILSFLGDAAEGFDANKNTWSFASNLVLTVCGVGATAWLVLSAALSWLLHIPFWLVATPMAIALGWTVATFLKSQVETAKKNRAPEHLRGSRVVEPAELQRQLDQVETENVATWSEAMAQSKGIPLEDALAAVKASRKPLVRLEFGGVTLPADIETQGILFAGSTGSGKSVALKRWINAMRAGGHKMLIVDPKPELIAETWEADSVVLNLFDARCARWDFWSEIKELPDIRAVAEGVFPPTAEADAFADGARNIFAGLLELASSNAELVKLMSMDPKKLEAAFAGTMAAGAINASNSRGTGAFLQRMMAELQVLRYPEPASWANQPKFSLTDWMLNDDDKRIVFLSYDDAQLPALRRLLTLWIDISIRRLLTMPEARSVERSKQRRVCFVLEELPALGAAIPMLEPLVTRGRSFGASWALVIQDPAQLARIYSPEIAKSLLSNTNTWLTFRTNDAETADLISKKLGEREEIRKGKGITMGVEEARDGKTLTDSQVVTQTVLGSEIMALPDNHAYLCIGGPYEKTKIRNQPQGLPKVAPAKVPRTDLKIKRTITPAAISGLVGASAVEQLFAAFDAAAGEAAEKLSASFTEPDEDGVIEPIKSMHDPLDDFPAADGEFISADDLPSTDGGADDLSTEDLIDQL